MWGSGRYEWREVVMMLGRGSGNKLKIWRRNELRVGGGSHSPSCCKMSDCPPPPLPPPPPPPLHLLVGLSPLESPANKRGRVKKILMNNCNWVGAFSKKLTDHSQRRMAAVAFEILSIYAAAFLCVCGELQAGAYSWVVGDRGGD